MSIERQHKINVLKSLKLSSFFDLVKQIIIGYYYSFKYKSPKMMNRQETLDYILDKKCSIVRFGDGELISICGKDPGFQVISDDFVRRLRESITDVSNPEILVCLPDFLVNSVQKERVFDNTFWRYRHFYGYRKIWDQYINPSYLYGDSNVSRPYIEYRDKSNVGAFYDKFKKIWEGRDIILCEGEKSRLGVGNDLFDGAKSVKRILCPQSQCYDKYDDILNEIKKYSTDHLILLSIGPTASIMPRDLVPLGYQALDIGNIDSEYEWFRAGTRERIAVDGKFFYEAQNQADVDCVKDERYFKQIVAKIL